MFFENGVKKIFSKMIFYTVLPIQPKKWYLHWSKNTWNNTNQAKEGEFGIFFSGTSLTLVQWLKVISRMISAPRIFAHYQKVYNFWLIFIKPLHCTKVYEVPEKEIPNSSFFAWFVLFQVFFDLCKSYFWGWMGKNFTLTLFSKNI